MQAPVFFKGKRFSAQDFINLETYLLARNSLVSDDFGIVMFTNPVQINTNTNSFIEVGKLSGITPSGRPIKLQDNERLRLEFEIMFGTELVWDIYIRDDHPVFDDEEATVIKEQELVPVKWSLFYIHVIADEQRQKITGDNNEYINCLYLGRWKLTRNQQPVMVQPPLVYNLAALQLDASWWQKWTWPLREKLREIKRAGYRNDATAALAYDIAFNYPYWPLNKLRMAFLKIQKLSQIDIANDSFLDEGNMLELLNAPLTPITDLLLRNNTYDLPGIISDVSVGYFWQPLIEGADYSIHVAGLISVITLTRAFSAENKFEIQLRFDTPIQKKSAITRNKKDFQLVESVERSSFGKETWYYVIDYDPISDEDIKRGIATGKEKGNCLLEIPFSVKKDSLKIYNRVK